jgi:hypothetical protein
MKKVTITIQEAPAYDLTKKGEVINVDTQETVIPDEGNNVNLVVKEGDETKTLTFNVNEMVAKYFPKKYKSEKTPRNPERYEQVKKLFNEGKTRAEIRKELNMKSVGSYIKRIQNEKAAK